MLFKTKPPQNKISKSNKNKISRKQHFYHKQAHFPMYQKFLSVNKTLISKRHMKQQQLMKISKTH